MSCPSACCVDTTCAPEPLTPPSPPNPPPVPKTFLAAASIANVRQKLLRREFLQSTYAVKPILQRSHYSTACFCYRHTKTEVRVLAAPTYQRGYLYSSTYPYISKFCIKYGGVKEEGTLKKAGHFPVTNEVCVCLRCHMNEALYSSSFTSPAHT